MHGTDWDDLRYVLAIADTGSVAAAANVLGVAHTTVLRRVTSFETETGARIFERTARGYRVSPDRAQWIEALRLAAQAIGDVQAQIGASAVRPGLTLRVTSTDAICATVLPGILDQLRADNPGLQTALMSNNAHLDLAHGHADITVRPALELPPDLMGKAAAHLGMAAYRAPGGAEDWIGVTGPLVRSAAGKWLRGKEFEPKIVTDSFMVMAQILATGAGQSLLPCIIGDADPRLARTSGPVPVLRVPLWVASHRDLGDSRRIAKLRAAMTRAIERRAGVLLGDQTAAA